MTPSASPTPVDRLLASPGATRPRRRPPASTRARASLTAAALALTAALAGCTAAGPGPATGADASSGAGTSAAARIGSCLRDAGFDVDDDDFAPGVAGMVPPGAEGAALADAAERCRDEAGVTSGPPTGAEAEELQQLRLGVAACMRESGWPDFPDPVGGAFTQGLSFDQDSGPMLDALTECNREAGLGGSAAS